MSPMLEPTKVEPVTPLALRPGTRTVMDAIGPGWRSPTVANQSKSALKIDAVIPAPTESTVMSPMPAAEMNDDVLMPAGTRVKFSARPVFTLIAPIVEL